MESGSTKTNEQKNPYAEFQLLVVLDVKFKGDKLPQSMAACGPGEGDKFRKGNESSLSGI